MEIVHNIYIYLWICRHTFMDVYKFIFRPHPNVVVQRPLHWQGCLPTKRLRRECFSPGILAILHNVARNWLYNLPRGSQIMLLESNLLLKSKLHNAWGCVVRRHQTMVRHLLTKAHTGKINKEAHQHTHTHTRTRSLTNTNPVTRARTHLLHMTHTHAGEQNDTHTHTYTHTCIYTHTHIHINTLTH